MKAMLLTRTVDLRHELAPLIAAELPTPEPGDEDVLIRVLACGVCHTELDEIEGRTAPSHLPIIPGHQVVGKIIGLGSRVETVKTGDRVGVSWFYAACGTCDFCLSGKENLCNQFKATGRDANGGYAEFMIVPQKALISIPKGMSDVEAAPHLCAGAIGYRSLMLTGLVSGQSLGLMGFGASAHLVLKLVKSEYPGTEVYVFSRSPKEREFALELGAVWAGDINDRTPRMMQAIIDTTPAWKPMVASLNNLLPGGRLVINAIRKENQDRDYLLNLDYPAHLWMEKEIKSVANVTRRDASKFLELAARHAIRPEVQEFKLEHANQALIELKNRNIRGAKVLNLLN